MEHDDAALRLGPLRLSAHRAIYGTIIVMAALALFDEGQELTRAEVLGVVVGPLLALAAAHTFSDAADLQIARRRTLAWADWRHVIAQDLEYVYVAIPPLLVLLVSVTADWDSRDTVGWLLTLGTASLMFWGGFAAARAQLSTRWQVVSALVYGAVGLAIVVLELLLAAH